MIKTESKICFFCDEEIPEKEIDFPTPKDENGIPEFFISEIIIECPNGHPSKCEASGY